MVIQIPAPSPTLVFFGRSNTTQTLGAAGSVNPILLQTHDIDELGGHSTTTQISRYVVKRPGLYNVSGSAFVGGTTTLTAGTQYRIAAITKNGSYIAGASCWIMYTVSNSAIHAIVPPVPVICALNDYIEIVMSSGLASTTMAGDASNGSTLRVDLIR